MKRSLFWLLDQHPATNESVSSVHRVAVKHAVEADRLGFASLWIAEHHFSTLGTSPNPAVFLGAVAQVTERIRLGPAISVLPLRNPIHVAEDYALVDSLSDGRLNMGVGSGSVAREFEPFGIHWESRKELYSESLSVIRERWRAAASGDVGQHSVNVPPVQSPTPPVYVATMQEESAYHLGLAGQCMLTLSSLHDSDAANSVARVRAHTRGLEEGAERVAGAESILTMFAHVAETEAKVRETAVPALASLMSVMTGGEALPDPEGFYERVCRNGTGLFGTPTQVDEQICRLRDLGVRHIAFVSRFGGMPRDAALRSLQLLAPRQSEETSHPQYARLQQAGCNGSPNAKE